MPTNNSRVNITLKPMVMNIVTVLAKQEHKSISSLARELILEALEQREDRFLSQIATRRDVKNAKKIKHEDAWS